MRFVGRISLDPVISLLTTVIFGAVICEQASAPCFPPACHDVCTSTQHRLRAGYAVSKVSHFLEERCILSQTGGNGDISYHARWLTFSKGGLDGSGATQDSGW